MLPEEIKKIIGFESAIHAKAIDAVVGVRATKFNSYSDGLTKGIEIAIGFAEFIEKDNWFQDGDFWWFHTASDIKRKSTGELLIHYINNVFNK